MEATWIITTVILITTAGGRLAQERRGASQPDRKEWHEVLPTKFTMKYLSQSLSQCRCQSNLYLPQVRVSSASAVDSALIFLSFSLSLSLSLSLALSLSMF